MFSFGQAPRRFAALLAAIALLALAALAVPPIVSEAEALGPGGGYHESDTGKGRMSDGLAAAWSAARAPLRWLRQSSRSFQSLMRLLAERSTGAEAPPPVSPPGNNEDGEETADEPESSIHGGEAGGGRNRGGPRVKGWNRRAVPEGQGQEGSKQGLAAPGQGQEAPKHGHEDSPKAETPKAETPKVGPPKTAQSPKPGSPGTAAPKLPFRRPVSPRVAMPRPQALKPRPPRAGWTAATPVWHRRPAWGWKGRTPLAVATKRGTWHVVRRGDTLWHISETHYGYGQGYPRIFRANSARIRNPDLIFPCQRLLVPPARFTAGPHCRCRPQSQTEWGPSS